MATEIIACAHCGKTCVKRVRDVNRAKKAGFLLFCSRRCFGLAHRCHRSVKEKRRLKATYDERRRTEHRAEILAEKKAYHRRTYNPAKAREHRKGRAQEHVAYCRHYYADPTKKQEKVEYDIARRGEQFANYFEAWRLLIELEREIRLRVPDRYERQKNRGYFLKINERKRHDRQDRRTP